MISHLEPLLRASFDVAAHTRVVDHMDHDDRPERLISAPVATAVEACAHGQSRGRVGRSDATVMGKRCLTMQALRVVTGGDQQAFAATCVP